MIFKEIKKSTKHVLDEAKHVKINEDQLHLLQKEISEIKPIVWDNESCHYFDPKNDELSAKYILVLSSLNFCFWPEKDFEYHNLAGSLKNVIENDPKAFDSENLINMNEDKLAKWFKGTYFHQQSERVRLLQEIGSNLTTSMSDFIKSCNKVIIFIFKELES